MTDRFKGDIDYDSAFLLRRQRSSSRWRCRWPRPRNTAGARTC